MLNFEQIKKDIKDSKLTFFGSDKLFEEYNPININELIAITISEYASFIYDKYEIPYDKLAYDNAAFRTSGGDKSLSKILNNHINTTGFYIDFYGPDETTIMIEIGFPKIEQYESFENYIKNIQKLFIQNAIFNLKEFDADYEFDQLYKPNSYIRPSEWIKMLQNDESYFENLAEELEKEYKKNQFIKEKE